MPLAALQRGAGPLGLSKYVYPGFGSCSLYNSVITYIRVLKSIASYQDRAQATAQNRRIYIRVSLCIRSRRLCVQKSSHGGCRRENPAVVHVRLLPALRYRRNTQQSTTQNPTHASAQQQTLHTNNTHHYTTTAHCTTTLPTNQPDTRSSKSNPQNIQSATYTRTITKHNNQPTFNHTLSRLLHPTLNHSIIQHTTETLCIHYQDFYIQHSTTASSNTSHTTETLCIKTPTNNIQMVIVIIDISVLWLCFTYLFTHINYSLIYHKSLE